ncbi:DUF2442 domain-containing protein [Methylomonas methanica]|uniref:DUF2442 domain-containing protein n=1 Tax=Methylomonas methanica TaxID=421 RepID=A0A177MNW7_METMH|nr:DUF2442 domain-containing protein [Methylomonas methanica]OAI07282.1 hypothetical protein A1332_09130 [Methylomonas methanica]
MNQVVNICSAEQIDSYLLRLKFDDGKEQIIDFKGFLMRSKHPDIRAYLDSVKFSDYRIEYGELVWGDYELCFPMIDLYMNRLEHGAYIESAA